jgi:hypothetical protein
MIISKCLKESNCENVKIRFRHLPKRIEKTSKKTSFEITRVSTRNRPGHLHDKIFIFTDTLSTSMGFHSYTWVCKMKTVNLG